MSLLSQFTITAKIPKKDALRVTKFRRRLSGAIGLQIDLAQAENSGEPLRRTRERWAKDPATGERKLASIPVRVKPWWWRDDTGQLQLSLRYGPKVLEIVPGKSAIEIGHLKDLPDKLEVIRQAVLNGELDNCAGSTTVARPTTIAPHPAAASKRAWKSG